jgi:hypothetical protein
MRRNEPNNRDQYKKADYRDRGEHDKHQDSSRPKDVDISKFADHEPIAPTLGEAFDPKK